MLSPEETEKIKKQIIQQIDSTFPEEQKASAKQQVETMNLKQFEAFLKQNNIMTEQRCVFCSIVAGDVNSYKLGENKDAIAVLEINPASKGHALIIPKKHSEEIPAGAEDLAKAVSELVQKRLKPKDILSTRSSLFGHQVLNLIPVYKNEIAESERRKASAEELESTLKEILEEPAKPIKKRQIKKIKEKLWLPKRIP